MSERLSPTIDALFARAIEDCIPLNVLFELTYRCNLRCDHCYVVDRGEEELSFDEIAGILDQLAAENCLFITFTGGEALLREDFIPIVRCAREKGFAVKVFTNGTGINEGLADELATLKPQQVGISIYGADATTHDRLTGLPGSFEASVSALRLLVARGITTVVKCLLMKENAAQVERVRALALGLGAVPQFDPIVSPRNDGDRRPFRHEMDEADLERIFSGEVADLGATKERRLPIKESVICRAARDTCSISPGGEVYPCVALPLPLGNLRQRRFTEIWRGPEAAKLRRLTVSDLHECASCPDADYCARCWGLAALESGDWLGPSRPHCRLARVRHRIAAARGKDNLTTGR